MGLPSRLAQAGQVRVTPRLRTRLPPEKAAAVEFGLRHDIPVDLGTATGGRWVRRFGSAMENTPLGAPVRLGAELQRGRRIPEVGRELAGRLYPQGVTAEAAGSGVRESLEDLITQRHQRANVNYDRLRRIEALPANTQSIQTGTRQVPILGANGQPLLDAFGNPLPPRIVPIIEQIQLPVDLRVPKQRLRPMYDRLRRQLAITQQQASPGLRALENLMDGPDFAPATQVDADLSVIKSLARGADLPELRDVSQGIAARGVEALSTAVDQAVARAGPRAVRALEQGRRATRLKYATAEVLDLLREEPVGAFQQLTQRGDTRINFLRDIAAQTPQDMPRVARAVLDELMDTGTQRGGYESAATIANRWERLGPETRNILFGQGHSQDLDQFFLLTRMLAEHPNPSMTAFGLYSTLSGMWLWANPATGVPANVLAGGIAALLNSRAGVRLLTRGLVIPGGTAAAAAWGAEAANLLGRAVEEEGGPPPPPSASASSPSEVTLTLRGESSR
jgi:hypothetical protein